MIVSPQLTLISARVQENRDPPSFVSQVHDLPPSSLSWDDRPTLKRLEASNPPVNIIGCNHSLDLILAKADWRARQIQKVNEIRVEKSEQRLKDLQEEIIFKQGTDHISSLREVIMKRYTHSTSQVHRNSNSPLSISFTSGRVTVSLHQGA